MRKELLYVAATMALVIGLGAGTPNWKGVSVRTDLPGNTSSVSSITFAGGVTAASFQATSTAAGYGTSNGWFIRTVQNGDWALDGAGGTHLQMSVGSGPKLLKPMAEDASAIATRSYVDGATNGLASQETNWWAVFSIPNDDPNWFDFTLKASTNAFRSDWPGGISTKVFIYTSVEPSLNGTPSWETFATNWYPRTYFYFDHDYNTHSVWNPIPVDPTGTASIEDKFDAEPGVLNPPVVRWVVMVHCTAIVHPTNRLSWAYLRQNKVSNEVTAEEGRAYWRSIDPVWVTYDPRYRITPYPRYPNLTNQHQQP